MPFPGLPAPSATQFSRVTLSCPSISTPPLFLATDSVRVLLPPNSIPFADVDPVALASTRQRVIVDPSAVRIPYPTVEPWTSQLLTDARNPSVIPRPFCSACTSSITEPSPPTIPDEPGQLRIVPCSTVRFAPEFCAIPLIAPPAPASS